MSEVGIMAQHLLAIEDDEKIANLVCKVGNEVGFISHAANGRMAMAAYDEFQPEVIVLDIFMPEMDGLEVLHFLHQRNSTSRIVILSGQRDYRKIAENLGTVRGLAIEASLCKPFRIADMRDMLTALKNMPPMRKKDFTKAASQ